MRKLLVQYVSDIHLEFMRGKIPNIPRRAPILVLAGDIGNPLSSNYLEFLTRTSWKFDKIFLVAGNHEFYNSDVESTITKIEDIVYGSFKNVSFLNNNYEDYAGYRWIGSTQWSRIKDPQYLTNDFNYIKDMTVEKYNNMHADSAKSIGDMLEHSNKNNIPSIVVTHFVPIHSLTDPKYTTGFLAKYNQCFNADLDQMIIDNKNIIKGWFYGHTHTKSIQEKYSVKFYCNPIGYTGENKNVSYEEIVEID